MPKPYLYLSTLLFASILSLVLLKTETLASPTQASRKIPVSTDLQQESRLNQAHLPLLLMFSIQNCPYCAIVREEFLEPMKISGDYESRVIMRIIDMEVHKLIDFDGRPIQINTLTQRYKISLAPTVILVNNNGQLLTEPLVGITTRDYYGGYLDQAIDEAFRKLKK
ncbi:MAG: hypothetical protein OEY89_13140 [Gammaproteobacteria bacterium]|nr:hypothetical protein [Gammaproteobacteria bacterium]